MKKKIVMGLVVALGLLCMIEPSLAKRKKKGASAAVGADYKSYTQVLTTPTKSDSHDKRLVTIYANSTGLASYKELKTPLPEGTILAKESFEDKGGKAGALVEITVMKKLKAGSKKESGDWYFAVLNPDLSLKEENPKRCVECHSFSPTDYVFGAPK